MFKRFKKLYLPPPTPKGDRAEYIVKVTKLGGTPFQISYDIGAAARRCKKSLLESREIVEVHIYRYDYLTNNIGDFQLADGKEVW